MDKKLLGALIIGGGALLMLGSGLLTKKVSGGGTGTGTTTTVPSQISEFLQSQPTIIVTPTPEAPSYTYPTTYNYPNITFPTPPAIVFPEPEFGAEEFFAPEPLPSAPPTQLTEPRTKKEIATFGSGDVGLIGSTAVSSFGIAIEQLYKTANKKETQIVQTPILRPMKEQLLSALPPLIGRTFGSGGL